jgi:hypothetical protein
MKTLLNDVHFTEKVSEAVNGFTNRFGQPLELTVYHLTVSTGYQKPFILRLA